MVITVLIILIVIIVLRVLFLIKLIVNIILKVMIVIIVLIVLFLFSASCSNLMQAVLHFEMLNRSFLKDFFGTVQHTPAPVIIHDKPRKQSASFK